MLDQTLSEKLLEVESQFEFGRRGTEPYYSELRDDAIDQMREVLREVARLLAPFEQPEVAELLERADEARSMDGGLVWLSPQDRVEEVEAHAAALVQLAEERKRREDAEAVLERVRALLEDWQHQVPSPEFDRGGRPVPPLFRCISELTAALGEPVQAGQQAAQESADEAPTHEVG